MASRYNSERYYSPTEYEVITKIEKEERSAAKAAAFRPIVYICSPYSHVNTAVLQWAGTVCRLLPTFILRSLWTILFPKSVKLQYS